MKEIQWIDPDFLKPKDKWDELSMREKAGMIKVAVQNGITDLSEIRREYNEFAEGGNLEEEAVDANLYKKGGSTSNDNDLIDWIIQEEGFNKQPEDIGDGKKTLGSGLTDPKWHDLYRRRGNKWSVADNRMAVTEEVANRRKWAEQTIPNWNRLPDSAQKALLSYKYNFDFNKANSPKLFAALAKNDLVEAARQMDATSKIDKFKRGLADRRKREQKWFLSDVGVRGIAPEIKTSEPQDNTLFVNPYALELQNTTMLPQMAPVEDEYIRMQEVSAEQQRAKNMKKAFEDRQRFNQLMNILSIQNNPVEEYVPQYNPANAPYVIRSLGGPIVEMANKYAPGGPVKYGQKYYDYNEEGNPLTINALMDDIVITPERKSDSQNSNYTVGNYARKVGAAAVREKDRRALELADQFNRQNEMHTMFPTDNISGETVFGSREEPKVIGMSGSDPLAEAVVIGETMAPLFRAASATGALGLENLGYNIGTKLSHKTPATTPSLLSSMHGTSNLQFGERVIPELNIGYIGKSLLDASNYKSSEGYKNLARRAGKESDEMGIGYFPEEVFTTVNEDWPLITFSKRMKNDVAGYDQETNTVDIDLEQSAGTESPFHEGLHWQKVGTPNIWIGPKYDKYIDSYLTSQPLSIRNALLDEVRNSPEGERLKYRENAFVYLREKTDAVLKKDYPLHGYLRNPKELQANGTEAGRALGIQPFTPYPGMEKAKQVVEAACKYNDNLKDIKAETPEDIENFWNILTGNYIPSTVGGALMLNGLKDE